MNNSPSFVRPGGRAYVSPEGIIYGTDGKLRWVYEFDQRKKPTVWLALLWKYVAVAIVVGALFLRLPPDATIFTAIAAQLALIGVAVAVALIVFGVRLLENGPKLCLLFTLDENILSCQQVKGKTDKEKVTHAFAQWVGGQSQPSLRVCGLRTVRLDCVKKLVADPERNYIRLRGAKGLNTVFAERQQISIVLDYLKQHCHQVK